MKKNVIPVLLLLALWWAASASVNRPFLPAPPAVFAEFLARMAEGSLPVHLAVSLARIVSALGAAFVPAFILGVSAGIRPGIDRIVSPMVYVLFPIPKIALLPIILMFLGLGNLSKIFLVALIVFFQFYLNFRDEASLLSRRWFDSLWSLGGGRRHLFVHVILPALLPRVFSSLRMTLGTSIAILFMAETFATSQGIGWYVMDAWARISYLEMYAGITGLSLMGLILFALLDVAEKRSCPWLMRDSR